MKALKKHALLGFRLYGTHVDKPDGVLGLGGDEPLLLLLFCPVGLKVEGAPHNRPGLHASRCLPTGEVFTRDM
jgi:hypothetical protein